MKYLAVFTTTNSLEEARALARTAVERKLAACVQISAIESFYVWKGNMQDEREFRLLFKTTDACYPALEAAIQERHSYELPAIYALALEHTSAPYAAWIEGQVAGA